MVAEGKTVNDIAGCGKLGQEQRSQWLSEPRRSHCVGDAAVFTISDVVAQVL
jgi:hypothetical protein